MKELWHKEDILKGIMVQGGHLERNCGHMERNYGARRRAAGKESKVPEGELFRN